MNDTTRTPATSGTGATMLGFVIGAAVGAGLALLLAPDSGKRTRERLGSTVRRWNTNAGHTLEKARDAVTDLGDDAKSAVRAGQDAFSQDRASRAARKERLHQSADLKAHEPREDVVR